MSDKKRILITGANGLLASRLIEELSDRYDVTALVYREPAFKIPEVRYSTINLSTEWTIDSLPPNMYAILHLAQSSRYKEFPDQAIDIFKVNTESTAKLLDYAVKTGVEKFIYFSTGGIYVPGPLNVTETSQLWEHDHLNYHFASKFCSEILTHTYSSKFKITIFRPFFIYGSGQRDSMLIPRLIDQIKRRSPILLDGNDGLRINPIHVNDACNVVSSSLEKDCEGVFNLAGPEILTLRQICEKIGEKLGIKPSFTHSNVQSSDLVASIEKMSEILYEPSVSFDEGLENLLD
jgi:UDP-glucose 4-epimerase